eukprot:371731-Prorocentrum_minimum.AAC.3
MEDPVLLGEDAFGKGAGLILGFTRYRSSDRLKGSKCSLSSSLSTWSSSSANDASPSCMDVSSDRHTVHGHPKYTITPTVSPCCTVQRVAREESLLFASAFLRLSNLSITRFSAATSTIPCPTGVDAKNYVSPGEVWNALNYNTPI